MPTTRPRHTITETPSVQAALDEVRRESGSQQIDMPELVRLGAQAKLAELRRDRDAGAAARRRLAARVLNGDSGVDLDAAIEVKRLGLIERY